MTQTGNYYASLWISHFMWEGKPLDVTVYLDDEKEPLGRLVMEDSGWQSAAIRSSDIDASPRGIHLSAGKHTLTFKNSIPVIPEIGYIRFARNKADAIIDDTAYRQHIEYLSTAPAGPGQGEEFAAQKAAMTEDDPRCEYKYELECNFNNTFMQSLYLYADTVIDIETVKDPPCASDPVLYLFENAFEPSDSWANDNHNNCQSYITAGISISATYMIMVRAKYDAYPGTCDIRINDYPAYSNVKVGGAGMSTSTMDGDYDHQTGNLNFFCCPNNSDANSNFMYLSTGPYDPVKYFKSGYSGPGVFPSINTRIKLDNYSGSTLDYVILSVNSQDMTDVGNCDVYAGLPPLQDAYNVIFDHKLKDLNEDDAIQTDGTDGNYNCHGWAGGVTRNIDPGDGYSPWMDISYHTIQEGFDNYYANEYYGNPLPRYIGALDYTTENANSSNADVAVWIKNGNYLHSSVKKDSDNPIPHGYAWESKCGTYERVMHPFGVGGDGHYGSESVFYIWDGTYTTTGTVPPGNWMEKIALSDTNTAQNKIPQKYITAQQSVDAGLSIYIENKLNSQESKQLNTLKNNLSLKNATEIDTHYNLWKATWYTPELSGHSSFAEFAKSNEYTSFLECCKKNGEMALAYIFLKYNDGDYLVVNAIKDLTLENHKHLLREAQNDLLYDRYTEDGTYIIPTNQEKVIRYISKIISTPENQWLVSKTIEPQQTTSLNPEKLTIKPNNPNPFNPQTTITYGLPEESLVTICIYDILGRKVKTLVNKQSNNMGWHSIVWDGFSDDGKQVATGIYLCKITTKMGVVSQKLLLYR